MDNENEEKRRSDEMTIISEETKRRFNQMAENMLNCIHYRNSHFNDVKGHPEGHPIGLCPHYHAGDKCDLGDYFGYSSCSGICEVMRKGKEES